MVPTVSFNPSASARPLLTVRRDSQLQARTPTEARSRRFPRCGSRLGLGTNAANPVQFFNLDAAGKASCNGITGTFSVVATAPSHFTVDCDCSDHTYGWQRQGNYGMHSGDG